MRLAPSWWFATNLMRVIVLGSGSWGTALAILLSRNGNDVTLWGRSAVEVESISTAHENARYLPGFVFPSSVKVTHKSDQLSEADIWVVAVPSESARQVASLVRGINPTIVIASKGLESSTGSLLSQEIAADFADSKVGVLSGPNLAVEVVRGVPTAAVIAFKNLPDAESTRLAFSSRNYRVYISDDVAGVELAGALKNVLAIGAGLADGLGFGDNTKGALLARGLHEMATLGMAMGAKLDTFLGIAGVGDLFATAASRLSRNYRVGRALGEGKSLEEALKAINQVAEGVHTSRCAVLLASRYGVSTPLFGAIDGVLTGKMQPLEAVDCLMDRLPREEGFISP